MVNVVHFKIEGCNKNIELNIGMKELLGLCPILSQYIYNSISIERNNKSKDLARQRVHMQDPGMQGLIKM